jgi:tetratricopeptide (TPR) repeat protein
MKRFIINILVAVTLSACSGNEISETGVDSLSVSVPDAVQVREGDGSVQARDAGEGGGEETAAPDVVQARDADKSAQGEDSQARDFGALWDEANTAYYTGDFAAAAALYDSIEASGMVSARLYYNKGNALFKMGKVGESILYYNKAGRLAPGDSDIRHKLAIAGTYTRNRIEPLPEIFMRRWMRGVRSIMSGDGWAWFSVGLFALVLGGVLLYLLPLGRRTRRAGFWGGLTALLLFVFAFSFASRAWSEARHPTSGVVVSGSAAVKSSPDNSGKDLFLLYEGDRVEVRDALGDWSEITVANGNRGWIRTRAIAMID